MIRRVIWDRPAHGRPHGRSAVLAATAAAVVAAAIVVILITGGADRAASGPGGGSGPPPAGRAAGGGGAATGGGAPGAATPRAGARPNIVFVLTDDLSMDLLAHMPAVRKMQAHGITFDDYFVSDSLCCPSRASIFTGNFPHDTGVYTNAGRRGGIGAFFAHGDESATFNLALQRAGYRTAMMGKYLNGYLEPGRSPIPPSEVPLGWNQWDVAGWGYPEFNYPLDVNGRLEHYGHRPRAYLTDVLARLGTRFIDHAAAAGGPFFLELATFAPHSPYTPAPRDRGLFPGLHAPRPPSFDVLPTNAPRWLATRSALTARQLARIDRAFRLRAEAVQGIDDMIAQIKAALARNGLTRNTYLVFSSDNGLHAGEYRLMPGKLTAFDTDIHVPLVIDGPGVPAGASTHAMTENVDLAATFAAIGGTSLPSDGHSLLALLRGATPTDWRSAVLIEHHGPAVDPADPDAQSRFSGNPTTYEAMRTKRYLYVEYADGEREFYDLRTDPDELENLAATLTPGQVDTLHAELARLQDCHTGPACWTAAHVAARP